MLQGHDRGEIGDNRPTSESRLLIALGANLESVHGKLENTLKMALVALENAGAVILDVSMFYNTPAFPAGAGPDYVNAAAELRADWTAEQAIAILHRIEADMGRERVQRWGQRTLDLDLIAMDDLVLPDPVTHKQWRTLPPQEQVEKAPTDLILPHPRVQDRAFVLIPLADIAPNWVHPVLGRSVAQMLAALPEADREQVVPVE